MKKYLFILFIFVFLIPLGADAAGKLIFSAPQEVLLGDQFKVTASIDAGQDKINALTGKILVGQGLAISNIQKSDGLIPLWIERPVISDDKQSISFAGIVPGGFDGAHELMTFVVVSTKSGKSSVSAGELEARANDTNASLIPITVKILNVKVRSEQGTSTVSLEDSLPPETFTVSIDEDPSLFGGAPFASFATQDKQSGVDHFEATFSYWRTPEDSSWKVVNSPYELPAESMGKLLYIRAVDRAGNTTTAHIATPGYYSRAIIFGIIITIILCVFYIAIRRRARRQSSSL